MNQTHEPVDVRASVGHTALYVFQEENDDFVAGRAGFPGSADVPYVGQRIGVLIGLTGFAYSLAFALVVSWFHIAVVFLPLGFFVGTAFYTLAARLADLRAEREGPRRWLVGEVVASRPWHASVSCTYAFLSPSGARLEWTEVRARRIRRAGEYWRLPETGAKVLILYIDDHHFRLL